MRDAPNGKGKGLFVDTRVAANEVVIEYDGRRIGANELQRRLQRHRAHDKMCYFMQLTDDVWIDGNGTRGVRKAGRINHCCAPNCSTQVFQVPVFERGRQGRFLRYEPRVGVVALRPLAKNEEVTIDYRWRSVDGNRHICRCGADACTGFL